MDLISSQDLKKVFKTILVVLVIFSVASHTLRICADRFGRSEGFFIGPTLESLDRFRRRCGDAVQEVSDICPEAAQGYCVEVTKAVRMLLGLQR